MKGPGLRIDLDVRRLWTCSRCGRVRKLAGSVTSAVCLFCGPEAGCMKLEERMRTDRPFRPPVYHEIEVEDDDPAPAVPGGQEVPPPAVEGESSSSTAGENRISVMGSESPAVEKPTAEPRPAGESSESSDFLDELRRMEESGRGEGPSPPGQP